MKGRAHTWVGGRVVLPGHGKRGAASIELWIDPEHGVVGLEVDEDIARADLGRSLATACRKPKLGAPRRPACVRVESHALAAEIERARLGIAIEVGPTPEIDELVDKLGSVAGAIAQEQTATPPPQDLLGRPWRTASPADQATAKKAAARFMSARPWDQLDQDDVVEVQAPSLGLDRGAALVVGHMGTNYGFALFASASDLETFRRLASEEAYLEGHARLDNDQLMVDITPGRRGEPPKVAVMHMLRDWTPVPPAATEVQLCAAVAEAFAAFDRRRGRASVGPVTLSLAKPAMVVPLRAEAATTGPRPGSSERPDRNAPCWCGSGKKYKKCHLDADAASAPSTTQREVAGRSRWGAVLDRMYPRVLAWAADHLRGWGAHMRDVALAACPDMRMSHALFVFPFSRTGETAGEVFRAAEGARLSANERRWLDANIDSAWTSCWSVVETDPGRSLTLRDIFSEEVRTVIEATASRMMVKHDLICGRVVTIGEEAYLDISHPRALGPHEADILRRQVAPVLGLTKIKAVPVEKLKAPKVVGGLLLAWQQMVDVRDASASNVRVQNTDGDDMIMVTDRYRLRRPRAETVRKLEAMAGMTPPDEGGSTWVLSKPGNAVHASWDNTTIAHLRFEGEALVVESNSRERAAHVGKLLAAALGDALGQVERVEADAGDFLREAMETQGAPKPLAAVPPLEAQEAIAELKRRTYATWADEPLPALGGRSARAAVKTAAGRKQVATLLDGIERHEAREPPAARFDVDLLRRELGLSG